jgi:hypothetical protein
LCYGTNRAMRGVPGGWWLVAGCLRCTLHVRTPPTSQLSTAPPHLLFLLSTDLQVAVGAAIDPYYHPLVLPHHQPILPSPPIPTLWCPAATDLVVLLRSYLQPSHLPFLLSAGIQVAVGAATDPYYPGTTPLSYPVTSPPFRRLLCLHYGALQPAVTHNMAAPPAPFPALLSPNLRDLVTTIDPAQPELPSYLLAS